MLALRQNSENYDVQSVQKCTEAQVHSSNNNNNNEDEEDSTCNDSDDIPYHIRKNAKPFTYGSVPIGFTTSELNHVDVEKPREPRKLPMLPPSPAMLRKRPSISPSPPLVHKTPTREEFEEMLLEKRAQSLRNKEDAIKKQIQCAAVEKDLSELQEKLNQRLALEESHAKQQQQQQQQQQPRFSRQSDLRSGTDPGTIQAKDCQNPSLWENVSNLPLSKHAYISPIQPLQQQQKQQQQQQQPFSIEHIDVRKQNAPIAIAKDSDRESPFQKAETPSFPEVLDERCTSPYPMIMDKTPTILALPSPFESTNDLQIVSDASGPGSLVTEFYEVAPHLIKYAKDTSEFWYKPNMTRQEAVSLLRNAEPGTFLVRNSTTYKNAYGLVLRVARPPMGVYMKQGSNNEELVRHFLLEPSAGGVRLKGYANEPLFTSLSAFVYEHSTNPLALPCKLSIPEQDILYSSRDAELIAAQKTLSSQGAACNVLYLFSYNTESLTGDEAIRRTVYEMFARRSMSVPVEVHFKVTQQGITLTDNTRTKFFRRFYNANNISYCSLDPDKRFWSVSVRDGDLQRVSNKTIFAFVARPLTGSRDNECHIFCDLAETQPASAIVSFINKVIPINRGNDAML